MQDIQFNTRVVSAHYVGNHWTITEEGGRATTCRYFIPATGPLSLAKEPPFPGLANYTGEWYQAAKWPKENIDFKGKRVAIIGTGATGVQLVPKLATAAKHLTVFQRTPNYVLPGRNYPIDEHQVAEIKENYDATFKSALQHPAGLAMTPSGKTSKDVTEAETIRQIFDQGWETGGFHYQFETFDDIFTDQDSNARAGEYIRQKIRAIVKDPATAELLCPKYPFISKRPPCGHFYYEAFNRTNVSLVDIRGKDLEIYEKGIRTSPNGEEYEFDMIIFALGFDAGTGALADMDIRGSSGQSLREVWGKGPQTFAGSMVPGFPNMFTLCGPHIPFGNMPVVLDAQMGWIGKAIRHTEKENQQRIEVSQKAADDWGNHVVEAFNATYFHDTAKESGSWFVGGNIPGKATTPLFYFGGVPGWKKWLEDESDGNWSNMNFVSPVA